MIAFRGGKLTKMITCALLAVFFIGLFSPALAEQEAADVSASASGPSVSARSAVLIEQHSGRVIFEKNGGERLSMASTTKIMTGLILAEQPDLEKEIVTTAEMVNVEGSSMGLRAGYTVSYKSLLYGLMLVSGNDAANTIAISLAGSTAEFAALMNEKAALIGMTGTNFVTPSGLDDENHYTTALDMCKLTAYAMENPVFAAAVGSKSAHVSFGNPPVTYTFSNHNKMLRNYVGAVGVKTGFTKKSGRCLVSAIDRDGKKLIAVTLNAPDDWNDHAKMLNFGIAKLETRQLDLLLPDDDITVSGGGSIKLSAEPISAALLPEDFEKLERVIFLPEFLFGPVKTGDVIGKIEYKLDGKIIAVTEIKAAEEAQVKEKQVPEKSKKQKLKEQFFKMLGYR